MLATAHWQARPNMPTTAALGQVYDQQQRTTPPPRSQQRTAAPPRMSYRSPFEQDALSLLFPSPIMRLNLADALPAGTLEALEDAVLESWGEHLAEQETLQVQGGSAARRATTDGGRLRAASDQERNEEFFYFQRDRIGVEGQSSEPKGWLASDAAQQLLGACTAAAAGYIERIAHHGGRDIGTPGEDWELDPDRMHVWASVHRGGSTHPRHIHANAAVSGVFYVRAPRGSGRICFFDPRGSVPPFEREVRHEPLAGELLLFPPWLSHAVASSTMPDDADADGARVSISFNYVDGDDGLLEGGRHAWGEATAGLDVVALEGDLGLEPWREDDDDDDGGDDDEWRGDEAEGGYEAEAEVEAEAQVEAQAEVEVEAAAEGEGEEQRRQRRLGCLWRIHEALAEMGGGHGDGGEPAPMGIRDDAAGLRQLLQCVVEEGQTQLAALDAAEGE